MSDLFFLILCCLIDFILSNVLVSDFAMVSTIIAPATIYIGLICVCREKELIRSVFLAFLVGIFIDFIAMNHFLVLALVYVVGILVSRIWSQQLSNSLFEQTILLLSTIFVKEILVYLCMLANNSFSIGISIWLQQRCIPTLLVNIPLILLALGLFELKKRFDARKENAKRKEESLFWKEYK